MQDRCPICNSVTNLKNATFGDHFQTNGTENPDIATPDGTVEFPEGSNSNSYYRCDVCPLDYEKEPTDIDEIVKNLSCNRNVAMLLNYYYGDAPIKELFTKENMILFKKPAHAYSFISKSKAKKQIHFSLTYKGKKTSGIILKIGKKDYKLSDLEEI